MREIVKHVIIALDEDDWELGRTVARHNKSRLRLGMDSAQPENVPIKFTWWERVLVKRAIRNMRDRQVLAKFVEYRINPKKIGQYDHGNEFF